MKQACRRKWALLLICFAVAAGIGFWIGEKGTTGRVILMPMLSLPEKMAENQTPLAICRGLSSQLAGTAGVLALWYGAGILCVGKRPLSDVLFPVLTLCRGCLFGAVLAMVRTDGQVLGTAWPGLLCYLAGTLLLLHFAAGGRNKSLCQNTGRFLTHAGAVFVITLCLGGL